MKHHKATLENGQSNAQSMRSPYPKLRYDIGGKDSTVEAAAHATELTKALNTIQIDATEEIACSGQLVQKKTFAAIFYLGSCCEKQIEKMLKTFDLSVNEFRILQGLKINYPPSTGVHKLKDFLTDQNSDLPRLIERLINRGLLLQTTDVLCKRVKSVKLTTVGLDLIKEINSLRADLNMETNNK